MSDIERKYFVDVFGEIVKDVRLNYDTKNNLAPYYLYGPSMEILKVLTERDKSKDWKYRKYPLIALMQDFKETKGTDAKLEYIVNPTVRIITSTKPDYYTEDRYSEVFKPFIYPIYEQLLISISESCMIDSGIPEDIKHDKWDRLSWGREGIEGPDGIIFNDYLDAMDINFKELRVFKKQECIPIIKASHYAE